MNIIVGITALVAVAAFLVPNAFATEPEEVVEEVVVEAPVEEAAVEAPSTDT